MSECGDTAESRMTAAVTQMEHSHRPVFLSSREVKSAKVGNLYMNDGGVRETVLASGMKGHCQVHQAAQRTGPGPRYTPPGVVALGGIRDSLMAIVRVSDESFIYGLCGSKCILPDWLLRPGWHKG